MLIVPMNRRKAITKALLLGLTCGLMLSGPVLAASIEKDIKVSLKLKQVEDLSPSGLLYVFYLDIANSSNKTYSLTRYDYRFMVGETEYIRLQQPMGEGISFPPADSSTIALKVKITYELLFSELGGTPSGPTTFPCSLIGELVFSEGRRERGRMPIAFSGEFPYFLSPRVEISALKAPMVTIGGAEVSFEATFTNPNPFPLEIDRISYAIVLGGHPLREGEIPGDKTVQASGSKVFSLPMLLNFFEDGVELRAQLEQSQVRCVFKGDYSFRTPWGRVTLPFDLTRDVPVGKDR